ncbi:hypothetical protein GCM10007862_11220 [Dyella lipolytica]|nr:hypothetical protein GCM10007862_11220 [Dyella lipolytica]
MVIIAERDEQAPMLYGEAPEVGRDSRCTSSYPHFYSMFIERGGVSINGDIDASACYDETKIE